jgi:sodium/proline symporter
MVSALILVLIFSFFHAGGVSGIAANLAAFPRFTDFFGIATPEVVNGVQKTVSAVPQFGPGANYGLLTIVSTMAWGLGYFGMPQVLVRFMAVKKIGMISTSRNIAVVWCFLAQIAAVLIGIIGRAVLSGRADQLLSASDAENVFIILSTSFFPPMLAGIIISGILAASMSSSDSYMLIVASSLANDIYKDIFKKKASDAEVMWVARLTMLAVTVFGIIIALSGSQSIFRVVSYAWAGLGAAFGPLVLFSLFWKRTTFPAAVAGMLTGGVMVILWKNVIAKAGGIFAVYELLPSFILSCFVILCVSLASQPPSKKIEAEFEKARAEEF